MSPEQSPNSHGCVGYAIGGASFIPLIGVIFGIVAIVLGITKRAWALVWLGFAGIMFTVVIYSALFYFGFHQRGGVYDKMRAQLAVTMLNGAVKDIEYYKLQHGHYPATLAELNVKKTDGFPTMVFDPTKLTSKPGSDPYFYYKLDPSGKFYFLRSVGPDGIPFTADDILPTISEEEREKTGLKLDR
jgi:hypothetical protein